LSLALHSLKKAIAAFSTPSFPVFATGTLRLLDVFEDLGYCGASFSRIRSRLEDDRPLVFDGAYLIRRLERVIEKRDSEDAAAEELQQLLREHDAVLGEQWGGFSNLLHLTLTEEQRVFRSIAPGYLDAHSRRSIEASLVNLAALREVAVPFGVDDVFVCFCMVLETLHELASCLAQGEINRHFTGWIQSLDAHQRLFKLWSVRADLHALSSAVQLGNFDDKATCADAALYAVTKKIVDSGQLGAQQRIVLDELLKASGLGSVQVYEEAGLFSSAELSYLNAKTL
jgi:hypothetical protein